MVLENTRSSVVELFSSASVYSNVFKLSVWISIGSYYSEIRAQCKDVTVNLSDLLSVEVYALTYLHGRAPNVL